MGRTIAKRLFQTLTLLTLKFLVFNLNQPSSTSIKLHQPQSSFTNLNQASSTSNEFNCLVLPKLNWRWTCMLECIELQNVD